MDNPSPNFLTLLKKYQENPYSKIFAPLADVYRKQGKLDDAIYLLSQGLKRHPDYDSAKVLLAYCIHERGNYEEALKILRGIEKQNPLNIKLYKIMGSCLLKLGDFEAAYLVYVKLQFLCPYDTNIPKIIQKLNLKNHRYHYSPTTSAEAADSEKNDLLFTSPPSTRHKPGTTDLALKMPSPIKEGFFKISDQQVRKDSSVPPQTNSTKFAPMTAEAQPSAVREQNLDTSFITETKADLLMKQGYLDEALAIYQALLLKDKHSPLLPQKITSILRLKAQPSAPTNTGTSSATGLGGFSGTQEQDVGLGSFAEGKLAPKNQQKIGLLKDLLNKVQTSNTAAAPNSLLKSLSDNADLR